MTWRKDKSITICRYDVVSLVRFNSWFNSHEKIMTGYRVMTIFVYKRLTRIAEIEITPVRVFPNISELEKSGIPYLAGMSLIECH